MGNDYRKAIAQNLQHMGTLKSEWYALGITDMVETEGDGGKPAMMPVFEFPSGYNPAPTLYPQGAGEANCELCGHPIKNVYWLANDAKCWLLCVGSECVTHFAGKSGEDLAKETLWARNREFLTGALDAWAEFRKSYRVRTHIGYGRYEMQWRVYDQNVRKAVARLDKALDRDRIAADSDNGVVTRWTKRYAEAVAADLPLLAGYAAKYAPPRW